MLARGCLPLTLANSLLGETALYPSTFAMNGMFTSPSPLQRPHGPNVELAMSSRVIWFQVATFEVITRSISATLPLPPGS
jgi:hypothetical protein